MRKQSLALCVVLLTAITGAVTESFAANNPNSSTLFAPTVPDTNALVTNEYAFWNADDSGVVRSDEWEVNSGSLFSKVTEDGPVYWTGAIDDGSPDAESARHTDSAIFRLTTARSDFGNVRVWFGLNLLRQTSTRSTPEQDWDGVHIFLHYQSEQSLYYASVARRDGAIVVKKKCPGGDSNGGTYYVLDEVAGAPVPLGKWQEMSASVRSNSNGTVTFRVYRDDQLVLTALDAGIGCPVISDPGKTGLRGDNTEFYLRNFRVTKR